MRESRYRVVGAGRDYSCDDAQEAKNVAEWINRLYGGGVVKVVCCTRRDSILDEGTATEYDN